MRPSDRQTAERLEAELLSFANTRPLLGIIAPAQREAFVEQLIESIRRIKYISVMLRRNLDPQRMDPSSSLFDPLRAAALQKRQGNVEEAFWLVFLSVHFGKHRATGWRLARDVYGALGTMPRWEWDRTSQDPASFRRWLAGNQAILHGGDGVRRAFGNHRKYESLDAASPDGTGAVIESYVRWVGPARSHHAIFQHAQVDAGGDPRGAFDQLYQSMRAVRRFGRTARFDYLTMVAKLGLASIEAPFAYVKNATGPKRGARLLFGGDVAAPISGPDLEKWLVELEAALTLGDQPMQVLEDALCNWQKSPTAFVPFRG